MSDGTSREVASLDLPDGEFIERFEQGCLSGSNFPHRAHLRMAWLYVKDLGSEVAIDKAAQGIRNLADANGQVNLYHDTLTRAWVYLVAAAVAQSSSPTFTDFLGNHRELLDKQLLLRFYSPGLLASPEARAQWVAPDLTPIPGAPRTRDRGHLHPGRAVGTGTYIVALRSVPTAVAIVSATDGVNVHGVTASSVTSLSLDPPLVLVCLQRESRILPIIRASKHFSVSYLSEQQREIAPHFASAGRPPGVAQYHGVPHRAGSFGVPVLTEASAWLECSLWSEYPGGDHEIVCGLVADAGAGDAHPLLSYAHQLL